MYEVFDREFQWICTVNTEAVAKAIASEVGGDYVDRSEF